MKLYTKTTRDKFEFPVAVADTPKELGMMTGRSAESILSMISHKAPGWHRIEVEDFIIPVCYPDNDGNLWYYDEKGREVIVRD